MENKNKTKNDLLEEKIEAKLAELKALYPNENESDLRYKAFKLVKAE